ncbi:MFS transporter [Paenibacillus sp. DMB5]|uniref:MFS transporter n=1 Tax=Paenibacillus sp. DMB5 TaxID=1780103 RepID=UPI00076DDC16|nr:MFS transporter [Paenibacillus sp. DMB5]KUP23974.1 hypothetical protein AWJ19_10355 [Paenibacillus sp. DMB5]
MPIAKSPVVTLRILLTSILLLHLGSYMVLPLLPIFLNLEKGIAIAKIGLILAVSPIAFQAGSLLGGLLSDRLGRRTIISVGAWINALALAGFAYFHSFSLFLGMSLLSGLGLGLNAPATKAAIATIASTASNQTTAFSLRGIAANIGTAAAGLLTFYVVGGMSPFVFLIAAVIFAVLGLGSWFFLPKECGDNIPCEKVSVRSYLEVFKNKYYMRFSLVSILVWAVYTQFSLSLPLRAASILPDPSKVSLVWTINSVIVIILQTPISRWIINKVHTFAALALGMLFIGGGLGMLYWSVNFYGLILCGAVFIVGEMLIVPTMDSAIARLGSAKMIGIMFGIANFVSGIGEGAGKWIGGRLISSGIQTVVPWLSYTLAAIGVSVLWTILLAMDINNKKKMNPVISSRQTNHYRTFADWILGRERRR